MGFQPYTVWGGGEDPHGGTELMNAVHTCSLKWPAAHVWFSQNFLCSSPAVCWICFSNGSSHLYALPSAIAVPFQNAPRTEWNGIVSSPLSTYRVYRTENRCFHPTIPGRQNSFPFAQFNENYWR